MTAQKAARRNHRKDALKRVENALRALSAGSVSIVEIAAPDTGIYLQFARSDAGFYGEAVGERNLPKLFVFRAGEHLRKALPELGWLPPAVDKTTGGNWHRSWARDDWDEGTIAELTVKTFLDAYGILPWALTATGRTTFTND